VRKNTGESGNPELDEQLFLGYTHRKMKIKIQKLHCERCGHTWTPRRDEVIICPKCKSPYWNKKKKE